MSEGRRLTISDVDYHRSYTPEQVAEIYGCTVGTLTNWRSNSRGPAWHKPSGDAIEYRGYDIVGYYNSTRVETADSEKYDTLPDGMKKSPRSGKQLREKISL